MSKATLLVEAIVSLTLAVSLLVGLPAHGAETKAAQPSAQPERPKAEWLDPDRDDFNGTVWKSFPSKILGRDVSYRLYLAPQYEQDKQRYPVIYWLHGMNGNQRTGAECFVPYVDAAIREHLLPPAIVVLPNGMVESFYRDSDDGKRPVESVIIKELIPHVDQTYRTLAQRGGRVIQGYSMGGYGAAHLGFKYPELFGTVIVDAGALDLKRFQNVIGSADHPSQWVEKNLEKLRKTHIRIGVGDQDYLAPANQAFHELLDRLQIEHQYEVVPGVRHSGTAYYKKLGTQGLEFHRKAWE